MPTLGQELHRLRSLKGWTLRDVEERTKKRVSNSYLYQLESDNVKEPSPNILYELSLVYRASYADLMKLAGFVVPASSRAAAGGGGSVGFYALDLRKKGREERLDFCDVFIRKKKKHR